jgi:hypothetical protein
VSTSSGIEASPTGKPDPVNISSDKKYYVPDSSGTDIQNIGSRIEKQRLELIIDLINKRKVVRDEVIHKLDDLIMYCDNKILEIGDEYVVSTDEKLKGMAARWQQKIIELENQKINENKELFRDVLFLRNEWIKSLLNYNEEKMLDSLLDEIRPDRILNTG